MPISLRFKLMFYYLHKVSSFSSINVYAFPFTVTAEAGFDITNKSKFIFKSQQQHNKNLSNRNFLIDFIGIVNRL